MNDPSGDRERLDRIAEVERLKYPGSDARVADSRIEVKMLVYPGAFLIFLCGLVVAIAGTYYSGIVSLSSIAVVDSAAVGGAAMFLGILIGLLGWIYGGSPELHGGLGALIILVGSFSLWVGGGFLVGAVLVIVAGILAIVLRPGPRTA